MKDPTKFLNETFGDALDPKDAAVVNDIVDPSKAETAPDDERFYPKDKTQLGVAIDKIVKELPMDFVRPFYKEIKKTLTNLEKGDEQDMAKNENKTEQALRTVVRNMLIEMNVIEEAPDDDDSPYVEEPGVDGSDTAGMERARFLAKRRSKIKAAAQGQPNPKHAQARHAADAAARERIAGETESEKNAGKGHASAFGVGISNLMPYDQIGREALGGKSTSGAKAVVFGILDKLTFVDAIWDKTDDSGKNELGEIILDTVDDYIDELEALGPDNNEDDLTEDDIALLREHPKMVADLASFEVYLQNKLEDRGYASAFSKAGKQRRTADEEGDVNFPDDRPYDVRNPTWKPENPVEVPRWSQGGAEKKKRKK